jgi:thiosulfate/3-mercaptopyruvate sulfurtransferase
MPTAASWFRALTLALCTALAAVLATPAANAAPDRGRLVDPAWLRQNLAEVLVLDASATPQHRAGHIPGAVSVDFYRYGPDTPSRAAMEQRMQGWGLSRARRIVIYDQGGDWMATRLFHDLYVHGVPAEQMFMLDGGLARWKAQGGAVTTEATPAPPRGDWQIETMRPQERVELTEFLAATGHRDRHVLLDALGPEFYFGQQKWFDRAGHVPGAVLLPSEDFFNPDKTFRSRDEITRLLRYHRIRDDQEVLSHCGGGGAAAVPWFALRFIAGHPKTRLFVGSQREWLRDERGLPFWTYASPQILRDAAWVAGWNNPMLRMAGATRLNLVDVRPAEAYGRGHIPFALNLPAATLRAQLEQPAALAALLGPAGVDPRHEVVLLSEQGLTPDTALAYLAFEHLGHERVSLLLDSIEDWGMRGFETTRQATHVGMPRSRDEPSVPPARYEPRAPRPVLTRQRVAAAAAPSGFAPVFVDVGRSATTASPPGRLVRLPFQDLLGANGSPKPAAELWKIIDKAGVPRQAELVFVADDMAEAAVGYVVFRLMGWPELKVWQP